MSKVMSIYNEWAFYEVVLPSVSNTEYSFIMDAELFHLKNNILIQLECINDNWYFVLPFDGYEVSSIDYGSVGNRMLPHYGRIALVTPQDEHMTILVEEKDNPLSVYHKYILAPNQKITVGTEEDNLVRYRYPPEKQEKSYVSHRHCSISYDGTEAVLEDSSSNGTFINNVCVDGTYVLNYGDNIRVFGLSMVYLGNILAINNPAGCEITLAEASVAELESLETPGDKGGNSDKHIFHRAPRSIPKMNTEPVTIDPPPNPKDMPDRCV